MPRGRHIANNDDEQKQGRQQLARGREEEDGDVMLILDKKMKKMG